MPLDIKALQQHRYVDEEDLETVAKAIEKTGEKDLPFPVTDKEGNMQIIGDANKTKRPIQHYKVTVFVDKATTRFTKEELLEINASDKLVESPAEYRVVLDVPVKAISIEQREVIQSGLALVQALLYEEVEHKDGSISMRYIQSPIKRQARELELIKDKYVSQTIKDAVVDILDLPEGLRTISVSEAVTLIFEFALNNSDLFNETDSNLE